jgi:hypothetical protein
LRRIVLRTAARLSKLEGFFEEPVRSLIPIHRYASAEAGNQPIGDAHLEADEQDDLNPQEGATNRISTRFVNRQDATLLPNQPSEAGRTPRSMNGLEGRRDP